MDMLLNLLLIVLIVLVIASVPIIAVIAVRLVCYRVPPLHYVAINRFGKLCRYRKEGLALMIPFVERVEPDHLVFTGLQKLDFDVEVTSEDLLGIRMKGAIEFRPDFSNERSIWKYFDTTPNRADALINSVKGILRYVAGTKKGQNLVVKQVEALWLLINCNLRLQKVPHEDPALVGDGSNEPIPLKKRLDFYQKYAVKIKQLLDEEDKKIEERSKIEESYAVDITVVDLTLLDFTPETKKTFEKEEQNRALVRATEQEFKLVDGFKDKGVSPDRAIDASELALGLAKKTILGIQGNPISINFPGLTPGGNRDGQ